MQDPLFDPSAGNPTERVGASARTQRRNAQRQRTKMGHPSGAGGPAAGAPEGQLFDTDPFQQEPAAPKAPGWGTAHGRPNYPGQGEQPQAVQQSLPFRGPGINVSSAGGTWTPKNLQGQQFGKSTVLNAVDKGTKALARSNYFRHAGFGAALRYTFGLKQVPSHVNDYLNSIGKQPGVNPAPLQAHEEPWGYPE